MSEPAVEPRRPRRSDIVAAHVREEILGGRLPPGAFVRPDAVGAEVGVSATPAREALLLLQSEGLLVMEPRRGFRVLPLAVDDVLDTFVAQSLLAGELAARAAAEATAADVRRLTRIQDELEAAAQQADLDTVERLNHEFHKELYAIVEAPKLKWLLAQTLRLAPRRYYAEIGGWPEATMADHRAVLGAVRASDTAAARESMRAHVMRAGELLAAELRRRQSEPSAATRR